MPNQNRSIFFLLTNDDNICSNDCNNGSTYHNQEWVEIFLLYNTACDTVFSITFNAANFLLLHVSKIEELLCCVCVTTTTSTKPTGST